MAHRWAVWFVIFVLAGASSSALLGSALTTDIDFTNTPEAKEAQQILEQRRLEQDIVTENWIIAGSGEGAVEDPAFVENVNAVLEDLNALGPDVVTYAPPAFPLPAEVAQDPETAPLGPIPSEDGRAVLFTVVMAGDVDDAAEHVDEMETIREEANPTASRPSSWARPRRPRTSRRSPRRTSASASRSASSPRSSC